MELHVPAGTPQSRSWRLNRGGKSTYHAPGQLVCYPILDLNRHGRDVKKYVRDLEDAVIRTLAAHAIEGERIEGLTGVWLSSPPRKICSIGVHVSRWVTTHGYALNVDLDPAPFTDWITACGLEDAAFTTIALVLGPLDGGRRCSSGCGAGARRGIRPRAGGAAGGGRGRPLGSTGAREDRYAMTVDIQPIPRPGWDPLPEEGCVGVVGRVLVREWGFLIAELRFSEHATLHEHPSSDDHIVTCVQGAGFASVGHETMPIREEQQVHLPKGIRHRLWTEGSTMTALVFGRLG